MRVEEFVVLTFKQKKSKITQGEPRQRKSEEAAMATAERLVEHFDGVAVIGHIVDTDTDEIDSPRIVATWGIATDVVDQAALAA